ncbi:hypothetical protein [Bradyrhizobium sp. RP6]|uniref:hypothetical protein n=1 Tax=Bradyrhizobium sp. RP6 TaxID=2489596 RepID=UPI000F538BCF|nr:hypothetical protein [Bradyrhizobium sp. RP6]RQH12679.1 hypothetical protein EHH60_14400 [Bradyrhizobium sp. RP6]
MNYSRMSYSDRARLVSDLRRRDAMNLLKRESARSASGCYVNPNARCPVCNAGVYFYANEHGSRVFFDHLGPPWPKHPCTDIPRDYAPRSRHPERRARGAMQELISAANVAGLFENKLFGRRAGDEWTLLVVIEVVRSGDENVITAEYLDSREGETTAFTCRSEGPVLEPGDFINMKGDEVSFLHRETLRPVTFRIGGTVVIQETSEENSLPPPSPARSEPPTGRRLLRASSKEADDSREPMTEAEMVHFNSDAVGLGELFGKLEPIIKTYAREHTRKPLDVARRLNAEGHRTASGAKWTPRLVRFLLALMFNDSGNRKPAGGPNTKPAGAPRGRVAPPKMPPVSMDDKDEIAKRLSALGRVTRRTRPQE